MLSIERADLVNDARVVLLGMGGNLLHLFRGELRSLLWRELGRTGRTGTQKLAQDPSSSAGHGHRTQGRKQLVQHARLLGAIGLPKELSHHLTKGWGLIGSKRLGQAMAK